MLKMGLAQNKIREKHNISDDRVTVTFENPVDNYMFKVNNKDTTATAMASFWYLYC